VVELTDRQADEVLVSLRSRLVKWKFSIVDFNLMSKNIRSQRSNLEHVLLGLVRQVNIQLTPQDRSKDVERGSSKKAKWVLTYECIGKRSLIASAIVGAITPIVLWGATPVEWVEGPVEVSFGGIAAIVICAAIGGAANIVLGHLFAMRFFSWVQDEVRKAQTAST